MASGATNWVHEKGNVSERDIAALERAKKIEKKNEKEGYRWVKINNRLQLFVPCKSDGKPTAEGKQRIALLKASQGIK